MVIACKLKCLRISSLTEGNCFKFPQGKGIQGNFSAFFKKLKFSSCFCSICNSFQDNRFNWLIKLPWLRSLLFFFLGLTPSFIAARGFAASLLACLGFSCSNFAKKNKRLLAVHLTASNCTLHLLLTQAFASKGKTYYLLMPGSSKTNLNPFSFYARLHSL